MLGGLAPGRHNALVVTVLHERLPDLLLLKPEEHAVGLEGVHHIAHFQMPSAGSGGRDIDIGVHLVFGDLHAACGVVLRAGYVFGDLHRFPPGLVHNRLDATQQTFGVLDTMVLDTRKATFQIHRLAGTDRRKHHQKHAGTIDPNHTASVPVLGSDVAVQVLAEQPVPHPQLPRQFLQVGEAFLCGQNGNQKTIRTGLEKRLFPFFNYFIIQHRQIGVEKRPRPLKATGNGVAHHLHLVLDFPALLPLQFNQCMLQWVHDSIIP